MGNIEKYIDTKLDEQFEMTKKETTSPLVAK